MGVKGPSPTPIHAVLTAARDLGARACVVFDGGVSTVSAQWVTSLVSPVIERDRVGRSGSAHPSSVRAKGFGSPTKRHEMDAFSPC